MALGSTVYTFDISLSLTSREIYSAIVVRAARHSSESLEFLACRVLAFCLEYTPELEFSKGLSEPEEPAIWARDLTGSITLWIEIGSPSARKLHKAAKTAGRVAVYTHKNPAAVLEQLNGEKIHRAAEIAVFSFDHKFIADVSALIDRRNSWLLSFSDGVLYLDIGTVNLTSPVLVHRIAD